MSNEVLNEIQQALIHSEADQVVSLAKEALNAGIEPMLIINEGLLPGMKVVGEKYEEGEYFLPHLIIAADGMKKAMQMIFVNNLFSFFSDLPCTKGRHVYSFFIMFWKFLFCNRKRLTIFIIYYFKIIFN